MGLAEVLLALTHVSLFSGCSIILLYGYFRYSVPFLSVVGLFSVLFFLLLLFYLSSHKLLFFLSFPFRGEAGYFSLRRTAAFVIFSIAACCWHFLSICLPSVPLYISWHLSCGFPHFLQPPCFLSLITQR